MSPDEGRTGFGEAPGSGQVTGESLAGIDACVPGSLADVLLVNVKLDTCGCLHAVLDLARNARCAGLGFLVGSMLESNLGVSAAAAVAATVG